MRINLSAEAGFFQYEGYLEFECLLAAAAVVCLSVNHGFKPGEQLDIQINPIINARPAGQYIFNPAKEKSFGEAPNGRSIVTMEIDHVDVRDSNVWEQLLCEVAVVLVAGIYDVWHNQNCWSKLHGGKTADTGWAESAHPNHQVQATLAAVRQFADGDAAPAEVFSDLVHHLMPDRIDMVRKTGAAQHLHAGET